MRLDIKFRLEVYSALQIKSLSPFEKAHMLFLVRFHGVHHRPVSRFDSSMQRTVCLHLLYVQVPQGNLVWQSGSK